MIVILHPTARAADGEVIARTLVESFKGTVEVTTMDSSSPTPWPQEVQWDDLLIVLYDRLSLSDAANDYIAEYLSVRKTGGLLLPVALDASHTRPPGPAEAIKAFPIDPVDGASTERLVRRVGAMIGLRTQQRDNKIFVSYRASDGKRIATQIEEHFASLGYPVWRDEARELDGETKILPGTQVQEQIDEALENASIVLLVDTPDAPHSHWIKHEVDTANARLIPILPLCFRSTRDHNKRPRFRALADLQRWVNLNLPAPSPASPLTENDLATIVAETELYLCEIFQRKCRIPFIVEKEFVSRNYKWRMLDKRMLICESLKIHSQRLSTKVLSHCSIFEQVHGPGIDAFSVYLRKSGHPNHALYIYDGELIPEPELQAILDTTPSDDGVVILHHQELAALIDSNFTALAI